MQGVAGHVPVDVKVTATGGFCGFCGDQLKLAVGASGWGGSATVQVQVAGEPSVFPAASVARTSNVCEPFPRLE